MASKRDVAWQLKRQELQDILKHYDIDVRGDARVLDDLVDTAVWARRMPIRDMLSHLSRDRLKEICLALDLDDYGREKSVLIDRLAGEERDEHDHADEESDPGKESHPTASEAEDLLKQILGDAFVFESSTSGWPVLGKLVVGELQLDVAIFTRVVTGSHRDPMERRIQNPGAGRPITEQPGRHLLLFGLWREQGDGRAVVAAFDSKLRVGRATRYSCFLPLTLLEQAADTGFAVHVNTKNERIYGFRPENLGRYLRVRMDSGELIESELDTAEPTDHGVAIPRTKTTPDVVDPTSTDELYIRPRVAMYSAFARLNYKPWFAIAEFVDNSIQSFLTHREKLREEGIDGPMLIDIAIDHGEISVTDRAAGIAFKDFPRAFSPAAPPDDATGLSEFGLGMKAAACWFARQWSVRTSALGDPWERTVAFDIPTISREGIERLPIVARETRESDHYTVVSMRDLRVRPRGRTLNKIRDHLQSIYRVLMAENVVRLRLTTAGTSEELAYHRPELLVAPYFKEPTWPAQTWYREFVVDLEGKRVTGWVGIMKQGSHSQAGFSVFRRRRLIEGSIGETYKPQAIFGSPNSFASQRIIGELFVEGFDVSHTKDGIQWGDHEDEILEAIRAQVNSGGQPLIEQANGYRARKTADQLGPTFGVDALDGIVQGLQAANPEILDPEPIVADELVVPDPVAASGRVLQARDIELHRDGRMWRVRFELVHDRPAAFFVVDGAHTDGVEEVRVRINLDHEFSVRWLNENEDAMQPVLQLIASLAIGERVSRLGGVKGAAEIRRNANHILYLMSGTGTGAGT